MRLLLPLLLLAGCVQNDPLVREGLWHTSHANARDLALQAANPADLARGRAAPTANGQLAAAAVQRLRENKLKRLPDTSISGIAVNNAGDSASAGQ